MKIFTTRAKLSFWIWAVILAVLAVVIALVVV